MVQRRMARGWWLAPALVVLLVGPLQGQAVRDIVLPGGARAAVGGPESAPAGLLLVHDWFGFTPFLRETVGRFGSQGYRVIAVDLYGGAQATDHAGAGRLLGELGRTGAAAARTALDQGLAWLGSRRRAVVGFSMGGDWAFETWLRHPHDVAAGVVLYGGGMERHPDSLLARLRGPLFLATGSRDSWALGTALQLAPRLDSLAAGAELFVYPRAEHAYAQPLYAGGANLDREATRVTWLLVDDFLRRTLGRT